MQKLTNADFENRYITEPNSGCWIWLGPLDIGGYGNFGRRGRAHRISYEKHRGLIPEGLEPDHLCRVRCCINPDHLELVTRRDNLHRSPIWNGSKTSCSRGHERNPLNFYERPDGKGFNCRCCDRENQMRYRQRRV